MTPSFHLPQKLPQHLCVALAILVAQANTACAPLVRDQPRAAQSTLECARQAIAGLERTGSDRYLHCMAAGLIAHRCSVSEAYLASIAKEVRDLFGPGDAQWRDVSADRLGVRCARSTSDDSGLSRCCETLEQLK